VQSAACRVSTRTVSVSLRLPPASLCSDSLCSPHYSLAFIRRQQRGCQRHTCGCVARHGEHQNRTNEHGHAHTSHPREADINHPLHEVVESLSRRLITFALAEACSVATTTSRPWTSLVAHRKRTSPTNRHGSGAIGLAWLGFGLAWLGLVHVRLVVVCGQLATGLPLLTSPALCAQLITTCFLRQGIASSRACTNSTMRFAHMLLCPSSHLTRSNVQRAQLRPTTHGPIFESDKIAHDEVQLYELVWIEKAPLHATAHSTTLRRGQGTGRTGAEKARLTPWLTTETTFLKARCSMATPDWPQSVCNE
jgi:hypothetical protein